MFKDELQEYNKLFDKAKEIEYEYGKIYREKTKPIDQKMDQLTKESDETLNKLSNFKTEITALNSLFDKRKNVKFFMPINIYKENLINNTGDILNKINLINEQFPTEQGETLKEKCTKCITAAESIKKRFEIKHADIFFWLSFVLGTIFILCAISGMGWAWIAGGIFFSLAVVLVVYSSIRIKSIDKKLNRVDLSINDIQQYTSLIKDLLKEKAEESKEDFLKKGEKIQSELEAIGDDLQSKQDNDLVGIKKEMHSYNIIDKAVNNLVSCYGQEIHWSSDYMKLFEQNFYLEINDEKDFLDACRDLIEKKKRDDNEKAERERAEHERRMAQAEAERQEYAQRKQQDEQRRAASSLCLSCKHFYGCSLKENLTSPVCSKYQNKY